MPHYSLPFNDLLVSTLFRFSDKIPDNFIVLPLLLFGKIQTIFIPDIAFLSLPRYTIYGSITNERLGRKLRGRFGHVQLLVPASIFVFIGALYVQLLLLTDIPIRSHRCNIWCTGRKPTNVQGPRCEIVHAFRYPRYPRKQLPSYVYGRGNTGGGRFLGFSQYTGNYFI